jgi:NADH dehydrogenase
LILQNFEEALTVKNIRKKERLMNHVIVGGGPTGVELAGALAELKKHVLPNDYPDLDIRKMHIHLIETGPRLLNSMSIESSTKALKFLKQMGVNVWLNTKVTGYDGNEAITNIGKKIQVKTLIWAAGVKGDPVDGLNGLVVDKANRITVDEFNRVKGYNNIFALGDVAAMAGEKNPQGHPMLASVAIQQGSLLAKNIIREIKGKSLKSFKYRNKGVMATIGRNQAVAEFSYVRLQGIAAWFAWMFIHLVLLVGFRNKMVAFINWVWSYFNYDRGTRLIIRPYKRKKLKAEKSIPHKMIA